MESIKQKFKDNVKLYIELYPREFEAMKKQSKAKRDLSATKTGGIKGTDFLDRPVCEVPATIDDMMINQLESDEYKVYTSKEFSRWIAKNYEAFRPIQEV